MTFEDILYKVTVKRTPYRKRNGIWSISGTPTFTVFSNLKGKIDGLGTFFPSNPNSSFGVVYESGSRIAQLCLNYQNLPTVGSTSISAWAFEIIEIIRITGEKDREYVLRIFRNEELILTETGSNPPDVYKEIETCETPNEWTLLRTYLNVKQKDFCTIAGEGNKVFFFVNSYNQFSKRYNLILLAFAESHEKCPLPEFNVECIPCKRCPEGSCAVTCEGTVCCYDESTGELVDSFSVEDYC
ncbi:hypothetical protein [Gloeothece citriformis]|uniref:hypothetical protein n=1 Tax=Gloeothece citriformis TaxID=2546356 RepID=UPI0012FF095C|nr:hypothetical protein [Gloeothece citriformis]